MDKSFVCLLSSTVPGPPYLSVAHDSETSAVVRWDAPDVMIPGMELQGYRLQFGRKDVSPLATLEFTPQERQYTVASVHRGATYLFKVQAKSRGGFGEEATAELQVPEHTPQGYPQIRETSNVTCCSVELSWSPPMLAERNGDITEYTLAYQETGLGDAPRELSLPASQSTYVLNSLKPNSAYDVKIRAHTSVGPGPYSPPIQYRTVAFETGRACLFLSRPGGKTNKNNNKRKHKNENNSPSNHLHFFSTTKILEPKNVCGEHSLH